MIKLTTKICIVGDFAVGKTSVVERFVNNQFSEKYLTTVGVKIDTKDIELKDPDAAVKLVIWDVAGSEQFAIREHAYLRGAAGIVYVVDGTRQSTVISARALHEQIGSALGSVPSVLLVNKKDLAGIWRVNKKNIAELAETFGEVWQTSARTGEDVEAALVALSRQIVARDIS